MKIGELDAEPIEKDAAWNLEQRVTHENAENTRPICAAVKPQIPGQERRRDAQHRPIEVVDHRPDGHERQDGYPAHARPPRTGATQPLR